MNREVWEFDSCKNRGAWKNKLKNKLVFVLGKRDLMELKLNLFKRKFSKKKTCRGREGPSGS